MAIGDEPERTVEFVDWHDLYNRADNDDDAVIDGLAYRGRWTAIASPAKAGKSTIILALAVEAGRRGMTVVVLDAEMGRNDTLERLEGWLHLKPDDLDHIHYCDIPPKLDTVQGATMLWDAAQRLTPDLVVIDGLNGVVNGAENDDTTWRDMYEWAIAPLKAQNVAILTADNLGKAKDQGPRGSSVKLDKADAILRLERTDIGVKLTATHRRTASYPLEQEYTVSDASEEGPAMRVTRVDSGSGYPPDTKRICRILDELGAPVDIGRRAAQAMLREHEGQAPGNGAIGKMLRWRKQQAEANDTSLWISGPVVLGTTQDHLDQPEKVVLDRQDHSQETPACGVVPIGVPLNRTPPKSEADEPGPPRSSEQEWEDPF